MIQKIKANKVTVAILLLLTLLGIKNTVSALQVASVPRTRYEIYYVVGGTKVTYTWRDLTFRNGYTYWISMQRQDYGINTGLLYTYYYRTY